MLTDISAHARALSEARDWLSTDEAKQFAKDFGVPFYTWDRKHDELAYMAGSVLVRITRASNGEFAPEGKTDPENSSHFFRSGGGHTPGQPSSYDHNENGLVDVERQSSAVPLYFPAALTARQKAINELVTKVLEAVPSQYRDLLVARYVEGKTIEELAADYGIKHQSMSGRLETAHRNFRKAWGEVDTSLVRAAA